MDLVYICPVVLQTWRSGPCRVAVFSEKSMFTVLIPIDIAVGCNASVCMKHSLSGKQVPELVTSATYTASP